MGNFCGGSRPPRDRRQQPTARLGLSSGRSQGASGNEPALGNQPLHKDRPVWMAQRPTTKEDVLRQREEFWDTAPSYEGRKEIWDALKAACETSDHALAQAILDSAGIKLPQGQLTAAYDELGAHYAVPVYCVSFPKNMAEPAEEAESQDVPASPIPTDVGGEDITVKVRLSLGYDLLMDMKTLDVISTLKKRIYKDKEITVSRQRVMFCGKEIRDTRTLQSLDLQKNDVVQVMVFPK